MKNSKVTSKAMGFTLSISDRREYIKINVFFNIDDELQFNGKCHDNLYNETEIFVELNAIDKKDLSRNLRLMADFLDNE